jgi:phenylacetate-CoA ligase
LNSALERSVKFVARKSPLPLRNFIVSCAGARNYHRRYGGQYSFWLARAREAETWNSQEILNHQKKTLKSLIHESVRYTDFYKEHFKSYSEQKLSEICDELAIRELPILLKSVRKMSPEKFINRARRIAATTYTSGTTGSPMVSYYDKESSQRSLALVNRQREWVGVQDRVRHVRLSGHILSDVSKSAAKAWAENYLEKQLLISTYHLGRDDDQFLVQKIEKFDPVLIEGYPSAILALANAIDRPERLRHLAGIITTAETLHEETRETLEKRFKVRVFDYYGASEGVPLIQQCEKGRYHLRVDSGIFEVLDESGQPSRPGEIGELVVTSFRQWMTPLIRYRTGDLVQLDNTTEDCDCKRTLPVIKRVLGRDEDIIIARDGRHIGMFSYRTLKHLRGFTRSQIVQDAPTVFRVKITPDGTVPLQIIQDDLALSFATVLGHEVDLSTEVVSTFEVGPNGKFRATVRNFDKL